MRELNQLRTLFEIRTVGHLVTRNLPSNLVLLGPPLLRHLGIERAVYPSVEFIDIHRMETVAQPIVFALQTADGGLMLLLLVRMAFKQCRAHPRQDLVAKGEPPKKGGKLFADHLFPNIGFGAFPLIPSAVIVHVALLLKFAYQGATAMSALDQSGECKVSLGFAPALTRMASIEHPLDSLP
ncbi:hypothetical protein CQ10_14275 [Bradyrhizobium valentinum]|nr:hypothetical protein CQ10_14275 [Bradyrhizobium valentinum]